MGIGLLVLSKKRDNMPAELPTFVAPAIQENEAGWGPTTGVAPDKFHNIPYQPFGKGDRLGRSADWTNSRQGGRYGDRRYGGGAEGAYGDGFAIVDTKPAQRPQHFGPRRHMPHAHRRDNRFRIDTNNQLNQEGQKAIRREQHQAQRRQNKRWGNQKDQRWERPGGRFGQAR